MNRVFNYSEGVNQSVYTILGSIFGSMLSTVALLLITRILGPSKFGVFSFGFALVLILVKINDLGLNSALIKYAAGSNLTREKNSVLSLITRYKLVVSGTIILIGILCSNIIAKLFNFPYPLIILISFSLGLAAAYFEHLQTTLQALHCFKNAVVIILIQSAAKLIGVTVLFLCSIHNVLIIFSFYILAPITPIFFSKFLLPNWVKVNLKEQNPLIQNKIFNLAKHSSISLIMAGIIENIDVLFVQKSLNTYETGLYGGVSKIALMFTIVAFALGNVLNSRVARYKDVEDLSKYLKKAGAALVLSVIGFVASLPFLKYAVLFTIGSEYLSGLNVLHILTASSFIVIAVMPFIALFYSYDANWFFSVSGLLLLGIVLLGNLIFVPIYGMEAAAWTRFVTRLALFVFTLTTGLYIFYKKYLAEKRRCAH